MKDFLKWTTDDIQYYLDDYIEPRKLSDALFEHVENKVNEDQLVSNAIRNSMESAIEEYFDMTARR